MKQLKNISVVIPIYNEEEVLSLLFVRLSLLANKLSSYKFEFLFVNDGSKDNTLKIIKELQAIDTRISFVSLSRNFGKETAMIAGFDHSTGDAVVVIDADLQDPPELIEQMIKYWEEGYDDVYAKRKNRLGESWLKRFTSKYFYKLLQKVTPIPIQRDTGDFRLLDRKCIDALKKMRESQRYTKGMFSWIGFKKKEILYSREARAAGKTKWSYWKLFNLAIEGFTSFTTTPLRCSSIAGFFISFLSFVYIVIIVVRTLLYGNGVAGYPSIMAAILFLGGVQLLFLGILGEYIARIFIETKNRPLYFVEEYMKSDS